MPPPSLPPVDRFVRRVEVNMFGCPLKDEDEESAEKRSRLEPIPDIGQAEAEAGLRRAVVRLSAHVGYHTAKLCEGRPTACCSQAECSCGLSYS